MDVSESETAVVESEMAVSESETATGTNMDVYENDSNWNAKVDCYNADGSASVNLTQAMKSLDRKGDNRLSFEEFKKWYISSEARVEVKMRRMFDKFSR